jgi:hypothetical protein
MVKKGFFLNLFSNRKTWFLMIFVFSFFIGMLVSYLAIANDWHRLTSDDLWLLVQLWIQHWPFSIASLLLFLLILS